jgi:hypothetical protein
MNPLSSPPGSLEDPRTRPDFTPHYFPRANGKHPPAIDTLDRNERITNEFLSAYYYLNCEYRRLREARQLAPSPQRAVAERERLQAIEKVLIVRDALEDRYAPLGVIADPVVKDGFAVDLTITFGNADAAGRPHQNLYTITAEVPIPLPKGLKLEDLRIKVEGPGITPGAR